LKKSEARYRAVVEDQTELICRFKPDTTLTFVNEAYCRYFGKNRKELIGQPFLTLIPEEDHEGVKKQLESFDLKNPVMTYEHPVIAERGEIRWQQWTDKALFNELGQIIEFQSVGRDITDRKIAEEALQKAHDELEERVQERTAELKESENYYQTLFENTGDASVIIEEDMTISMANSECERLFGYEKEELEGKKLTELISPENVEKMKEYQRLRRIDPTAAPGKYECNMIDKKGKKKDVVCTAAVIPGTKKSVATFSDITEIHRINRALRTLSACNMAVVQADNEDDLLNSVCQKIIEDGGYRFAWVGYLEDDKENTVSAKSFAGYEEGYIKTLNITLTDPDKGFGPVGKAIRTGQPVICRNTRTDPQFIPWREEAVKRGYASVIAFPLISNDGRPFGVLTIYAQEEDVFDEKEVILLTEMAGDLSYGIMSIRSRNERDRTARELEQSLNKMQRILKQTVGSLSAALETRDPYTAGHQKGVANLACKIARKMSLSKEQIEGITVAGSLHDIGKINIPSEILSRPGKLTEMEFAMIKTHCEKGYEILKDIEFPWPIAEIVLQHHERIDGSGYPSGLTGDEILIEAKILAVADVVEAMASHRPYRPALGLDIALEEISKNKGVLYDADVVDACLKLFEEKEVTFE